LWSTFIFYSAFAGSENVEMWELKSPILEKNSTDNILNIELKSSPSHDINNFPIEIAFLNGTQPEHTTKTISPMESNNTGDTFASSGLSVPSTLERVVPIKNFNIIIYDSKGNEIWKKINQSALSGRGFYDVNFNEYRGNLTVLVDKIVPANSTINGVIAPVKFTSSLVEK
jgi:hypothetical protein